MPVAPAPAQNEPHGSADRQAQLPTEPQPAGSDLHVNESGSPPTSETPRSQYWADVVHVRKPHANMPDVTGHEPFAFTSTPAAFASHSLP